MRRNLLVVLLFVLVAITLSGCSEEQTELERIRLPMGYIPNVQYAPFYVTVENGYFREAGIEVDFDYSTETDGIALLGAGEVPFVLASGEQVLLARAQGLPVVTVLTWWQDFPVAIAALEESGIERPEDLRGRRIGIPGPFGASYIGLQALLFAGGLTEEDVLLDSIGFNQVEALVANQVEAAVVYANNEPIQLRERGYPVDLIRVADYVHLISNGIVSNEQTISENPDLVQRMVNAVLRGVAFSLENPEEAYEISSNFVEGLEEDETGIQRLILEASTQFWQAERLGYSDPQAWRNMHDLLLQMVLLSSPLDVEQAYTNRFIEEP